MIQKQFKVKWLAPALLVAGLLTACTDDKPPGSREAKTDDIKVDLAVHRYDRELKALDKTKFAEEYTALEKKYPEFSSIYLSTFLPMGGKLDTKEKMQFFQQALLANPDADTLYRTIDSVYTDAEIKNLETGLENALKRVRYFLPKSPTPRNLITFNGYFKPQPQIKVFTLTRNDSALDMAVQLEMFLGSQSKYYNQEGFYGYMLPYLRKEYILPNAMVAWYNTLYELEKQTDNTLLSQMIHAGKKLYFLDLALPDMPDSMKIEYTGSQLAYNKAHEAEMWQFLTQGNLLYKSQKGEVEKFLAPGPFTSAEGVPQETPPRMGEWLGWQIVRSYMKEHPEITPEQLFNDRDYKRILKGAMYKPKN